MEWLERSFAVFMRLFYRRRGGGNTLILFRERSPEREATQRKSLLMTLSVPEGWKPQAN